MGVIWKVICRDCKVERSLDKLKTADPVKSRAEAVELAEQIKGLSSAYREALLISFMAEHENHNCTLTNDCWAETGESFPEESIDFWAL